MHELRSKIDNIDDQLVKLFVERMEVAEKIGAYKKENNLPVFDPGRERNKLQDVAEKAGSEMAQYTRVLYAMLFELSRSHQSRTTTQMTQ